MKSSMIMFCLFAALASNSVSASASNGLLTLATDPWACLSAFKQSDARNSCRLFSAKGLANNICEIEADCTRSNGRTVRFAYIGGLSDVARLQNCDGNLQLGSC